MDPLTFILAPLQYPFMAKAILVSASVGAVCALLSCFLILKSWSLLGDAISHAVLPGVVLAYIIGVPFSIGAFVFALLAVLIIGAVKTHTKIKEDAVMGIVFTTLFALGLILISRTTSSAASCFGSPMARSPWSVRILTAWFTVKTIYCPA